MEWLSIPAKLVVTSALVCLVAPLILLALIVWQFIDPVDQRYAE